MDTLSSLRTKNPGLRFCTASELRNHGLGVALTNIDTDAVLGVLSRVPLGDDGVAYVASDARLESLPLVARLKQSIFGGLEVQAGHCVGHNQRLNALEYHNSSEVVVPATEMVLFVDNRCRIQDGTYSPETLIACYLRPGEAVELFATTLHFAPLGARGGFRAGIMLPRGTNLPLAEESQPGQDPLLFAANKWIVAHPQSAIASRGAHAGILGDNLKLVPAAGEPSGGGS